MTEQRTAQSGEGSRRNKKPERRSNCPVACTLDLLGDRWTLLIVRDLLRGKARFGDFLSSAEAIPTNILTDRLKRLEEAGLLTPVPYSEHPPRFEYRLTEKGRELGAVVRAVRDWGLENLPGTKSPDASPI